MPSTSDLAAKLSDGCTKTRVVGLVDCRVRNDLEIEIHMSAIVIVAVTPLVRITLRSSTWWALCASDVALRTSDRGEAQK